VAAAGRPSLLYIIKQVELAVRASLEETLRPVGLTVTQYTALTILERQPDLTSAELARNSFVTTQSMADMTAALLSAGLVERRRDPSDRRRLVLKLTPRGRRMLHRVEPSVTSLENRMVELLPTREVAQVREGLLAFRRALSGGEAH
jgi:DNA-binding MarR family transcriptional regulator